MAKIQRCCKFKNTNFFAIIVVIFGFLSLITLFITYNQEIEISKEYEN